MSKVSPALAAGLLLLALAACSVSRPRLDHPDPPSIVLGNPIKPERQAQGIRRALDERHWQTVTDAPGLIVATLTREPFNLSMRMEIDYGGSEVRMKLLELTSLDGAVLAQNQIDDYQRWSTALRYSIVRALDEAMRAKAPRAG